MKNWKRKYTSILLTVVMVAVILMPMFSATPVFAAETWVDVNSASALQTAINNAPADVKTNIRLTANISGYHIKIPYDKYIVLDLNGYSASCNKSGKALFTIYRCPNVTIMNSSPTTSTLSGYSSTALYLYNSEDGYSGNNQRWCAVHLKGKISITQTYVAGGTSLYVDTPDVNLGTLKFGSEKKVNYLVNFDANGGTNVPNAVYKRIYVACTLPTEEPTRNGYTLKGWNTAANGTGTNYNFAYSTDAVTTLYAQWSQNQTLTYNANGHNVTAPTPVTMTYTAVTNTAYGLSDLYSGYDFDSWNTKADGTGAKYAANAQFKAANTDPAATTLYAIWKPQVFDVKLNKNGGTGGADSVTATYDADMPTIEVPTKVGYTFTGYSKGTGQYYMLVYDANGNSAAKWNGPKGSLVGYELDAQWTANQYTVMLDNGESVENSSATATYNEYLPDVTVPTWKNHVFYGYFTEENGEGTQYVDKDGKGVVAWNIISDTTLYAFWKESAKVESMDLTLGGDIGMRYHVAVNDPELQESGTMTVSIGGKKAFTDTKNYSEVDKDNTGAILFPFNVNSIQLAEPVTVEFKDKDGKVIAKDAKSVEDYYNLVKDSTATAEQKEMVRTLVDYGYYAQQALSKTRGWTIGEDYKASTKYGELTSTKDDLKAYKPVISGKDANVKDIQLSLLLDNKTTLCVYVLTKNAVAPIVTVDEVSVIPTPDEKAGWWLVKIENIDALNLSTMHKVEVGGYTVYLSALSYASVASDAATIEAMRALRDYYEATLKANGKKALTSATVAQSEYEYTGEAINPELTVMAGSETVTDYKIEWNGDLINAGTYTGLVTSKNHVGGVTVKVTITPKSVTAPKPVDGILTYNGEEQTGVVGSETPVNGPMKAPAMNVVPEEPGYTLSGNTAIDAGKYTATAMLTDAVNYCWDDGTTTPKSYEWSIEPLKVEIPEAGATEFSYDGTQKILEVAKNEFYTIRGNVATDAGEYVATVTLINTNNTCWSDESIADKQITWKITKKVVEKPQYTVGELTYTGAAQTGVTVASNEAYTISGTTTATKAGSYTATITLNKNYSWSNGKTDVIEIKWSIAKKKIEIPTANTGLVYNKSEQIGVNGGEGYTLSGTTKAINAGSYTATATLTDTNNTCWSDGTTDAKTINWSIAKATPTVTGTVNVTYHPNGGSAEFGGTYERSVEGTFSYDSSNNKTTFVPDDKVNYNAVEVIATVTEDPTVNTMNVTLGG